MQRIWVLSSILDVTCDSKNITKCDKLNLHTNATPVPGYLGMAETFTTFSRDLDEICCQGVPGLYRDLLEDCNTSLEQRGRTLVRGVLPILTGLCCTVDSIPHSMYVCMQRSFAEIKDVNIFVHSYILFNISRFPMKIHKTNETTLIARPCLFTIYRCRPGNPFLTIIAWMEGYA